MSVDFWRDVIQPKDKQWNRWCISTVSDNLPKEFKGFCKSFLDQYATCDWDQFLITFWNTFWNVNEQAKEFELLEKAKMLPKQSVNKYVQYFRSKAAGANVTDSKQLGRYFWKGLHKDLILSGQHQDIPHDGFHLNEAIAYAENAERSKMMLDIATGVAQSGGNVKSSNDHGGKRKMVNSVLEPANRQANNNGNKNFNKKHKNSHSKSNNKPKFVDPKGTPTGILYVYCDVTGRLYVHSSVSDYRRTHGLCAYCGSNKHSSNCPGPQGRVNPDKMKEVGELDRVPGSSVNSVSVPFRVNAVDNGSNRLVDCDIYIQKCDPPVKVKCLPDSGAFLSYVNGKTVTRHKLQTRSHPRPYHPIGADGKDLPLVTEQALLRIGFGWHVESFICDVLNIGDIDLILGRDWMKVHDPIIRASTGFVPVFDREECKFNHGFGNINIIRYDLVAVTDRPRAFDDVSPLNILTLSDSDQISCTKSATAVVQHPWCPAWETTVSDNFVSSDFSTNDVSDTSQTSSWTSPTNNATVTTETSPLTKEQPGLPQELPKESAPQESRKNKKKKKKIRKIISIITSRDKLHHIMLIRKANTTVQIVPNIMINHSDDDNYFAAFVYPTSPILASVSSEGTQTASSQEKTIPPEYADLAAAFSTGETKLPAHGDHDLKIDLVDGKIPTMGPLYNMSEEEMKIVHKYVKDMMDKGLIRPSTSPCGAPILFAKKKDGSLRLCVDYRRLNDITIKNVYPLPLITEMLDRIAGSEWFTSLDLKDAYWLVRIRKGDEWKTAFRTRYGLFEYLVMPFGLSNAPSNFQAHINRCFSDMIDIYLQIYLDDFLIYSKSYDEHVQHVRSVLQRVIDSNLQVNLKKCTFHTQKVSFLGYEVSNVGVNMLPNRVKAIQEWEAPTNLKALQSFLGFCNFYRGFIHQYSEIVVPLTNLTKKNVPYVWTDLQQKSFDKLKQEFMGANVMRHFDRSLPVILETDASDFAISGILSQEFPDGIHPIGYLSRKLRAAELNYDTHDKEMLAIIESLKGWRHFTMETSVPVKIITDHNNLKYFMTSKSLNRRQVRWAQMLADYNFVLFHRPGSLNQAADALSRRDQDALDIGDREVQDSCLLPPNLFALIHKHKDKDLPYSQFETAIKSAYENDTYYKAVMKWFETDESQRPNFPTGSGGLKMTENGVDDGDKSINGFLMHRGLLYYKGHLYVPESLRLSVLLSRHDSPLAGHFGVRKTRWFIERDYWWPKMANNIEKYVKSCDTCQRMKSSRQKYSGLLHPLPVPSERWESVTLDFITDLPPCEGFDAIMVVVDRYTKMAHFIPCRKDITAVGTAKLYIDRVFWHHGIPETILSDRGTQFNSDFWKSFWRSLEVEPIMSTSYHPETDGQTERTNSTLNQYIRVYCSYMQDNWVMLLPKAEFTYNNSVHSATSFTPFFANSGYHPKSDTELAKSLSDDPNVLASRLIEIGKTLRENLQQARENMKRFADTGRQPAPSYKPGDKVMLSTKNISTTQPKVKWAGKWAGPYEVVKEAHSGSDAYVLKLPATLKIHPVFHTSLLKPYQQNEIEGRVQEPPPPIEVSGEEEYEVEKILSHKYKNGRLKYYIRWKGYGPEHDEWVDIGFMDNCQDVLAEWLLEHPEPPARLRKRKKR